MINIEKFRNLDLNGGERLPPWISGDRFCLWSLWDMIRFFAPTIIIAMSNLRGEIDILAFEVAGGRGEKSIIERWPMLEQPFKDLLKELEDIPLSQALRWKSERLSERLSADSQCTIYVAMILLKEFHNDVVMELTSAYFLMISQERKYLYVQPQPLFGQIIAEQYPDASYDIACAGRCMAVDEWTAAVFHLMRVLEKGLHALAADLEVPMSEAIDQENWKNIIDRIERKIRDLEQLPKGPSKAEATQFYSEMATNFRYFKDAWRNHVSHSRANYDERQATTIWNHVKFFMGDLAGHRETKGQE